MRADTLLTKRIQWTQLRWTVLAAVGAAGLVLGFIGWSQRIHAESPAAFLDAGYRTLALLGFSGAPGPDLPWTLGLARFIVPIVAGWSAIAAVVIIFRDRVQLLGLPFRRGHVVVIGLGDKGVAFTRSARDRRQRVVVIESDPGSTGIKAARELGAAVITGDGQDPEVLLSAGVDRAGAILAVTGDDGANAEIVVRSRELARDAENVATVRLAHIRDPELAALLRIDQLVRSAKTTAGLDFFSIDELGARGIISGYARSPSGQWRAPLILHGFSPLNRRILYEAARSWSCLLYTSDAATKRIV